MKLFQPLLALIAAATDQQLAQYLEYLKTENRNLRDKLPKAIRLTPQERQRLIKFGIPLGSAIKSLITIVTPKTFARWVNRESKRESKPSSTRDPGRPPTPEEIRETILRIARETGWGYGTILGELTKLGITVSRSTVKNILKEAGLDPGPKRGKGTWHEFIRRHKETLWACDFFTKNVWTIRDILPFYVLLFIHIGTRKVYITGMTPNPDDRWMRQQARNLAIYLGDATAPPAKYLIHDNDTKFTTGFKAIIESEGIKPVRTSIAAPNMKEYVSYCTSCGRFSGSDHMPLREFPTLLFLRSISAQWFIKPVTPIRTGYCT